MSEPKWRDIKTVTEELYKEGQWAWVSKSGYSHSARAEKCTYEEFAKSGMQRGQVYGPIPDSPKEPPIPRRFTAIYEGQPVSGACHCKEYVGNLYRIWLWHGDWVSIDTVQRTALEKFKWIDEE
jgi:hypothetical protein